MRKLFIIQFFFVFFTLHVMGASHYTNEEGWRQRNHFKVEIEGQEHDFQDIHRVLADNEKHITDSKKFGSSNVALMEFSIILKSLEGGNTTQERLTLNFFLNQDSRNVRVSTGLDFVPLERQFYRGLKFFVSGGGGESYENTSMWGRLKFSLQERGGILKNEEQELLKRLSTTSSLPKEEQQVLQSLVERGQKKLNPDHLLRKIRKHTCTITDSFLVNSNFHQGEQGLERKLKDLGSLLPSSDRSMREVQRDLNSRIQDIIDTYSDSEQHIIDYLNNEENIKGIIEKIEEEKIKIDHRHNRKHYVAAILLHLHSYRLPCAVCAPSLFRECEVEDGFAKKLQRAIATSQHTRFPYFMLMVSYRESFYRGNYLEFIGKDAHEGEITSIKKFPPFFPVSQITPHWSEGEIRNWIILKEKELGNKFNGFREQLVKAESVNTREEWENLQMIFKEQESSLVVAPPTSQGSISGVDEFFPVMGEGLMEDASEQQEEQARQRQKKDLRENIYHFRKKVYELREDINRRIYDFNISVGDFVTQAHRLEMCQDIPIRWQSLFQSINDTLQEEANPDPLREELLILRHLHENTIKFINEIIKFESMFNEAIGEIKEKLRSGASPVMPAPEEDISFVPTPEEMHLIRRRNKAMGHGGLSLRSTSRERYLSFSPIEVNLSRLCESLQIAENFTFGEIGGVTFNYKASRKEQLKIWGEIFEENLCETKIALKEVDQSIMESSSSLTLDRSFFSRWKKIFNKIKSRITTLQHVTLIGFEEDPTETWKGYVVLIEEGIREGNSILDQIRSRCS